MDDPIPKDVDAVNAYVERRMGELALDAHNFEPPDWFCCMESLFSGMFAYMILATNHAEAIDVEQFADMFFDRVKRRAVKAVWDIDKPEGES